MWDGGALHAEVQPVQASSSLREVRSPSSSGPSNPSASKNPFSQIPKSPPIWVPDTRGAGVRGGSVPERETSTSASGQATRAAPLAPQFGMDTAQRQSLNCLIKAAAVPSAEGCIAQVAPVSPMSPIIRFGVANKGGLLVPGAPMDSVPIGSAHAEKQSASDTLRVSACHAPKSPGSEDDAGASEDYSSEVRFSMTCPGATIMALCVELGTRLAASFDYL
jgi:hypothetical protein